MHLVGVILFSFFFDARSLSFFSLILIIDSIINFTIQLSYKNNQNKPKLQILLLFFFLFLSLKFFFLSFYFTSFPRFLSFSSLFYFFLTTLLLPLLPFLIPRSPFLLDIATILIQFSLTVFYFFLLKFNTLLTFNPHLHNNLRIPLTNIFCSLTTKSVKLHAESSQITTLTFLFFCPRFSPSNSTKTLSFFTSNSTVYCLPPSPTFLLLSVNLNPSSINQETVPPPCIRIFPKQPKPHAPKLTYLHSYRFYIFFSCDLSLPVEGTFNFCSLLFFFLSLSFYAKSPFFLDLPQTCDVYLNFSK